MANLSWFLKDHVCSFCDYEVVVTQGKQRDYRYYCSNPDCSNHTNPVDLGDMEDFPDWCRRASTPPTVPLKDEEGNIIGSAQINEDGRVAASVKSGAAADSIARKIQGRQDVGVSIKKQPNIPGTRGRYIASDRCCPRCKTPLKTGKQMPEGLDVDDCPNCGWCSGLYDGRFTDNTGTPHVKTPQGGN